MSIQLKNISFRYDGQSENIIDNLSISFHKGFSAIVGQNGLGKSTLVNIIAGKLNPDSGNISFADNYYRVGYLEQDCYNMPHNIDSVFENNKNAGYIRHILKIEDSFLKRYDTLSFGERKRVQIASVLIENPDILILDEITNHIDNECRDIVLNALKGFKGVGVIISHDRYFLDALVLNCLFIRKDGIKMRAGNYSKCLKEEQIENAYKLEMYEKSRASAKKLEKRYKDTKDKSDKKRGSSISKRGIDKKDHDAKGKVDMARLTGKDNKISKQVSNVHELYNKSIEEKNSLYFEREKSLSIELSGERSKNKYLFYVPELTIELNKNKKLIIKEITIKPESKIGLFGANGAGKTTLVNYILNNITLPKDKILYIPQEIKDSEWSEIYKQISSVDKNDFGLIISMIDRLGSNAKAVLSSLSHSPGEMRKLMLAYGLLKRPNLVIMDEPTNHLDIASIERLEESLAHFNSALILVSHDKTFLENVVNEKWLFVKNEDNIVVSIQTLN